MQVADDGYPGLFAIQRSRRRCRARVGVIQGILRIADRSRGDRISANPNHTGGIFWTTPTRPRDQRDPSVRCGQLFLDRSFAPCDARPTSPEIRGRGNSEHFQDIVDRAGGGDYQTLINDAPRVYIRGARLEKVVRQTVREEVHH